MFKKKKRLKQKNSLNDQVRELSDTPHVFFGFNVRRHAEHVSTVLIR